MALQQKREDRASGAYTVVTWDDEFGHGVIWEYDSNDHLQRRGVFTHVHEGAPDGSGPTETIWHNASGHEIMRPT